ncbi:MAG: DNA pilot protein [Microviridae sp.]|nr:MAG: DNA pilot protein [Microviridae sp.]
MSDIMNIGMQAIETGYGQLTAAQQYDRQKNLMDIQNRNQQAMMQQQMQNQKALNAQGQQIQLDTWEKTNYPAQMEMLKKAGLNASLLYSKGGVGGSTGGQGGGSASGGSASSGQAEQARPMNISNILQMRMMEAQAKALEADARDKTADAVIKEGGKGKPTAEIGNINADTEKKGAERRLAEENIITQRLIQNKTAEEVREIGLRNKWTQETWNEATTQMKQKTALQAVEIGLNDAKIKMTTAEIEGISVRLAQEAERLMQTGRALDQKDLEIAIQTFKTEMEAKYPGVGNILGAIAKKAYLSIKNVEEILNGNMPKPLEDRIK